MGEDDVFELDIAMQHVLRMHIGDPAGNLSNHDGNGFFRDLPISFQQFVKMPLAAEFHEEVEVGVVCEAIVEVDQVGVVQKGLYLDLADDLGLDLLAFVCRAAGDAALPQYLHRSHEACPPVPE